MNEEEQTMKCKHDWSRYNRFWFDGRIAYRCFKCGEEITQIDGLPIPEIDAKIAAAIRARSQA
jgi:hypothetical protein